MLFENCDEIVNTELLENCDEIVNAELLENCDEIENAELLEIDIDDMNSNLTPLSSFILPGGNEIIVAIHMARVVCRRAERRVVSINNRTYIVNPNIIIYINRLSDYLFVLGRWVSNQLKIDENLWSSNNISSSK